jgi:uncharacterized HhH-GPD family protein
MLRHRDILQDGVMALHLAQEPAADELLAEDPMALLVGMLLDQQVPLEWAFGAPYRLAQRLGVARLDAAVIADYDPDELIAVFTGPPALHRFPKAMAERTQKLAQMPGPPVQEGPESRRQDQRLTAQR